jgi:hypothetical protein
MHVLGWTIPPDYQSARAFAQYRWVRSSAEWFVYPWVEWETGPSKPGLGPFFAATVPIACLMRSSKDSDGGISTGDKLSLFWVAAFFVFLSWWFLNNREPRYFLGALVFLVPLVGWTMSQVRGRSRIVFDTMVAACVMTSVLLVFLCRAVQFRGQFIYTHSYTRAAFYQYPEALDRLPPGSTIMNLGHRTRNFAMFGENFRNRVLVHTEAFRTIAAVNRDADEAATGGRLRYEALREAGITHVLTEGKPELSLDQCVALHEVGAVDKDQLGNVLKEPIRLYEVELCAEGIAQGATRRFKHRTLANNRL